VAKRTTTPPTPVSEAGPVPEDNRPGHHPAQEQDKPIDKFVARAQQKVHETETAPARQRAERIATEINDFYEEKRGGSSPFSFLTSIPLEAVVPALAFVDAARKPAAAWDEVGANKAAWLAGIALLPGLGAWRYAADLEPRLAAAERARSLAGG
jgi:hypothetical protein